MTPQRIALCAVLCASLAAMAMLVISERALDATAAAPPLEAEAGPAIRSGTAPPAAAPEPGLPAEQIARGARWAARGEGTLQVVVTHAGVPHRGAEVRVYVRQRAAPGAGALGWGAAGSATTGADGAASWPAAPGSYFVAASAPGLAPGHAAVVMPEGEAWTRATISLAEGVDVVGRVVTRGGEPVPLAAVALSRHGQGALGAVVPVEERVRAVADAAGRFRLAVAPGPYVLEASAPGFTPARARLTAPAALDVQLGASAIVEGVVRGVDGAPAAGAEVFAAGGAQLVHDTVGSSGGFAIEVTPGTYSITARAPGAAGAWPAPVTVAAGGRARGVEIRLGRPCAIAGVVAGPDGMPVRGAAVAVSPHESTGEFGRANTDAAGRFAVEALGPGRYDLAVTADGWTAAVRAGIALLAGDRVEIAVTLKRSGAVEGTVSDGAGRPLAGVRVTGGRRAAEDARSGEAEARTDAAGRYRLGGLASGRSDVVAARDGASGGVSAQVEVVPGSVARLDLTLPDTGRLEGMVFRRDRGPVGGAVVLVRPSDGTPAEVSVEVDRDGAYALQLPAGEYAAFAAPAEGAGVRRRSALARVAAGRSSRLDLDLDGAGASGPPAVVQVLEAGGSGSPGALVLVTTADDLRSAGSAASDEEGVARVELAEGGRLLVRALRGGRVGGPVPLAASGTTVVTLRAPAQLRGRVVALDGPPVAGFTLQLTALGDDASVASAVGGAAGVKSAGGVQAPRQLEFGGDAFELADVPAGPVRVVVQTPSGRSGGATLQLAPGEQRELEVPLDPGATVEGRAVDARSGSPVAGASVIVLNERGWPPRPEATTGADGRFRLTGFPAGVRRFRLIARGYAPSDREADLGPSVALDLGDVALANGAAGATR